MISKLDRASCTASLALQQGGSVLLDEVSIRGATLDTLDVCIDVINYGLLILFGGILPLKRALGPSLDPAVPSSLSMN